MGVSSSAEAISRIEVKIDEIRHPAGRLDHLSALLTLAKIRWQGTADFAIDNASRLLAEAKLPANGAIKGITKGSIEFSGTATTLQTASVDAQIMDASFADESGLHAGEKIDARLQLGLKRKADSTLVWDWKSSIDWLQGEVFWQPLYLTAGHVLKASGTWSQAMLKVDQGEFSLAGIGRINGRGTLALPEKQLQALEVSAQGLDAGRSYETLVKPLFEKSMLGNLEMAGKLDFSARMNDGELQSFRLGLHDIDLEDRNRRFALYKINADLPWSLTESTLARASYGGGHALSLPLGKADLNAKLQGWSLNAQEWNLPVLDGMLSLQEISAVLRDGQWHGHMGARLSPIAMSEFTHAVGWPRMEGQLAGSIPQVTYSAGMLAMDGAMQFNVFDGRISVSGLSVENALGLAPRLKADIAMQNLDLDLLTRTFSFGAMQGRLDGDVSNMTLSSWKPVSFDAAFRSSAGNYPRKISQRAVENISALGGAGAAAAIQRSFLRFFNEFNYAKIGLSCKLRNGVCAMDGVEPAQSGYVIVKGSGIPSITVLGYNRSVSWNELLERIQRITSGNAKPVIK